MNIAFVGCGTQADLTLQSLGSHLDLRMLGAFDPDPDRRGAFVAGHGVRSFESQDDLLDDPALDIVAVFAPVAERAGVVRACLERGKHVYADFPLAATPAEAGDLVTLADTKKVCLGVAPVTHLSEPVQTLWRALRNGDLGEPQMVKAAFDGATEAEADSLGAAAALQIAPLVQMFGPVAKVTGLATGDGPEAVSGLLEFKTGLVASLTVGTVGPVDRSVRVVGSQATATLADILDFATQARLAKGGADALRKGRGRLERLAQRWAPGISLGARMTPARPVTLKRPKGDAPAFDAARGLSALTEAVRGGTNRVGTDFAFHVADVAHALVTGGGKPVAPKTALKEVPAPCDWAA